MCALYRLTDRKKKGGKMQLSHIESIPFPKVTNQINPTFAGETLGSQAAGKGRECSLIAAPPQGSRKRSESDPHPPPLPPPTSALGMFFPGEPEKPMNLSERDRDRNKADEICRERAPRAFESLVSVVPLICGFVHFAVFHGNHNKVLQLRSWPCSFGLTVSSMHFSPSSQ